MHAIDITEKIDEFNKLVYDVDQFAQDLKPALWLTYLSKSAKDKYQNCHDLHMLYTEVQPLLHFMLVIAQRMKDKIITPTLSERLCSLLQQQLAINIKATALENQQNHPATNLHFSSKSQTNKLTYITKNSSSLANHLVVAWKESRHNPYVLMNTLLEFFHEKNGGKIIQIKQSIPQATQEKPSNTSQFKL
jgi:hypothetical protein